METTAGNFNTEFDFPINLDWSTIDYFQNDTNIRVEKKDMDKFFIFDKLMKIKITSYDERGE